MSDNGQGRPFPGLTDIHAHPAMNAWLWRRKLERHYWTSSTFNPLSSLTDFKMIRKGRVRVLWSSLHVPEPNFFSFKPLRWLARILPTGRKLLYRTSWTNLLEQMGELERQVAETADIDVAQSNAHLDQIIDRDNIALIHTVEGGHVLSDGLGASDLDGQIERLETLADRGVASLTLAHLFPNDLAGHTNAIPKRLLRITKLDPQLDPTKGLTEVGCEVLEEMVRLRVIPDVMHCNRKSRYQIYELVGDRIPIIASHAGVQSMNNAEYNLDRTDVDAITRSKGLIGVIFMPEWLEEPDPTNGLDAIWRTMATVREWSGSWNAIAIGTDFDGFTDPADDCKSEGELGRVGEMLGTRGLTRAEVEAVLGTNAREVLARGWS